MKILIFGGAGFVGGNLAIFFANRGDKVLCVDNLVRRGSENNLKRFKNYNNISFLHGDIRNVEDLNQIALNPDVVLECSAQPTAIDGYKNPMFDFTNNTSGLLNVLEFCRKRNSGLIFWSTNKTYSGDKCNSIPIIEKETRLEWSAPDNFIHGWTSKGINEDFDINGGSHTIYGITKVTADLFCQEWAQAFDIPVIINRFSCLYGPYQFGKVSQGWITWFALAKKFNYPLTFYGFGGKQVRDYLHIDDVGGLIEKQIGQINNHRGSYYNVGGGEKYTISVYELEQLLSQMFNNFEPIKNEHPRKADQKIYISDISKVSDDFNWEPSISLKTGLGSIFDWINSGEEDFEWLPRK